MSIIAEPMTRKYHVSLMRIMDVKGIQIQSYFINYVHDKRQSFKGLTILCNDSPKWAVFILERRKKHG